MELESKKQRIVIHRSKLAKIGYGDIISLCQSKTKNLIKEKKPREIMCEHDYKNAIQIGNVDYVCPLCKELLNPLEWFFMNSFEFIDVTPKNLNKIKQKKYE